MRDERKVATVEVTVDGKWYCATVLDINGEQYAAVHAQSPSGVLAHASRYVWVLAGER